MSNEEQDSSKASTKTPLQNYASKAGILLLGLVIGAVMMSLGSGDEASHSADAHQHGAASQDETLWTCSMHPQIKQPEPGQCPICGMDLIPVSSGGGEGEASANRVVLSPRAQALAKLRTTKVTRLEDATAELRLLGRFEPNERTLKTVTAWTGGRIDRLHVNVTGVKVRAGQVIVTLYSPEVFAAHQDLLVAKRHLTQLKSSPEASRNAAAAALEAARERLRLLGVEEKELSRMEDEERPTRAVSIRSPFSGTIIKRLATEGAYVSTGTPLYRVANLSSLWLQLDAYENDLSRLAVGQKVQLDAEALPGEKFEGRITFIDPTIDPRRRTAKVRVQVNNRDGRLRPGMFAEAMVNTQKAANKQGPLVIPKTAPLFTGRRAIVYVEVQSGDRTAYEPRSVRLGPRLGAYYPIVAGLNEGDQVVSRGAFALDADLQIRGGASMMFSPDDLEKGAWDSIISLKKAERRSLAPVVTAYLQIQASLADDSLSPTQKAARKLIRSVQKVSIKRGHQGHATWTEIAEGLKAHGQHIAHSDSLEKAREGFEPLSESLILLLSRFGNPLDHSLRLAFCPMATGSDGAQWVQKGSKVDNSYFGESMLSCGEVRQEIPSAGYLASPAKEPHQQHGGHQH